MMEAKSQYQIVVDEYIKRGKNREAGDVLKKMADIDPADLKVRSKLADLYTRDGNAGKAVDEHIAIAEELNKKGHLAEALQVLEKGLKIDPKSARLRVGAGARPPRPEELRQGRRTTSRRRSQQAPNDTAILSRLGEAYLGAKKIEEAEAIFKRLLELDPNDEDARVQMGARLPACRDDFDRAYDEFLPVVEKLVERARRRTRRRRCCSRSSQKNPAHVKSLAKLVEIYQPVRRRRRAGRRPTRSSPRPTSTQGQFAEAASVLEVLVGREPQNQQHKTQARVRARQAGRRAARRRGRARRAGARRTRRRGGVRPRRRAEAPPRRRRAGRRPAGRAGRAPRRPLRRPRRRGRAIELSRPAQRARRRSSSRSTWPRARSSASTAWWTRRPTSSRRWSRASPTTSTRARSCGSVYSEKGQAAKAAEQCLALAEIFRLKGDEAAAAAAARRRRARLVPDRPRRAAPRARPPAAAPPAPLPPPEPTPKRSGRRGRERGDPARRPTRRRSRSRSTSRRRASPRSRRAAEPRSPPSTSTSERGGERGAVRAVHRGRAGAAPPRTSRARGAGRRSRRRWPTAAELRERRPRARAEPRTLALEARDARASSRRRRPAARPRAARRRAAAGRRAAQPPPAAPALRPSCQRVAGRGRLLRLARLRGRRQGRAARARRPPPITRRRGEVAELALDRRARGPAGPAKLAALEIDARLASTTPEPAARVRPGSAEMRRGRPRARPELGLELAPGRRRRADAAARRRASRRATSACGAGRAADARSRTTCGDASRVPTSRPPRPRRLGRPAATAASTSAPSSASCSAPSPRWRRARGPATTELGDAAWPTSSRSSRRASTSSSARRTTTPATTWASPTRRWASSTRPSPSSSSRPRTRTGMLECSSMLGICFMEKGMPKLAVKWFEKGLKAPGRTRGGVPGPALRPGHRPRGGGGDGQGARACSPTSTARTRTSATSRPRCASSRAAPEAREPPSSRWPSLLSVLSSLLVGRHPGRRALDRALGHELPAAALPRAARARAERVHRAARVTGLGLVNILLALARGAPAPRARGERLSATRAERLASDPGHRPPAAPARARLPALAAAAARGRRRLRPGAREGPRRPARCSPGGGGRGRAWRARATRVLVNGRPDVAVRGGRAGVQLPEDGLPVADVRRAFPRSLVGASCHSLAAARRAEGEGADFVVLGPVFATPGKEARALGAAALARGRARRRASPCYAIGGIDAAHRAARAGGGRARASPPSGSFLEARRRAGRAVARLRADASEPPVTARAGRGGRAVRRADARGGPRTLAALLAAAGATIPTRCS